MRAVYKCKNPFHWLSADIFNPKYEFFEDAVTGVPVKVAVWREAGEAHAVSFDRDGLAEITDPEDIKAMRAYIESRHDNFITEVSFEGNEADLYEPVEVTPEEIKEKPNHDEGIDYNSLSDWDKEMLSRMSK